MAIDEVKFKRLKDKAKKAAQEADRAEGALEQEWKKLQDTYEVDSLEDAEGLLEELAKEEQQAEKKYEESLEAFEEEWGELID